MRRGMLAAASLILVLTACGQRTPSPEAVAQQWAEAVKVGDTAAVGALMPVAANNMLFAAWWGRANDFRKVGRLQAYTIESATAAGNSTNVLIEWTGSQAPVCTTVQIAPDRTVSNVSDFETCKE